MSLPERDLYPKPFKWTKRREKVALALAEGYTDREAAEIARITRRTVQRWKRNLDFQCEVDRLTHMVGIASRAERLRIAMRAVRQFVHDTGVKTKRDVLDWLKFAQGETDGIKLDLAALVENALGVADSGPEGVSGETEG